MLSLVLALALAIMAAIAVGPKAAISVTESEARRRPTKAGVVSQGAQRISMKCSGATCAGNVSGAVVVETSKGEGAEGGRVRASRVKARYVNVSTTVIVPYYKQSILKYVPRIPCEDKSFVHYE